MTSIDWDQVQYFGPWEFSENPNRYAKSQLIYAIDQIRDWYGHRVFPSPHPGALARFDGSPESRHYAVGRLSDANDLFPDGDPREFFLLTLSSDLFGGIGIYWDTYYEGEHKYMFHLDKRPLGVGHNRKTALIWIHDKQNGYRYPQYDPKARNELFRKLAP